jgi:hypothetical protein
MLSLLISTGAIALALIVGIKNDIKSSECKIDMGIIPDIIMALSIMQIVIPVLYIGYVSSKKLKNIYSK